MQLANKYYICALNLQCRDCKMSMEEIEHKGIVDRIEGDKVFVRVMQQSACAGCHAKGVCSSTDTKDHLIESSTKYSLRIGDSVSVSGAKQQGLKAVFWAYVMPFLLILMVLIIGNIWIKNEVISGLSALAVLVPYFMLLRLFRAKLESKFVFNAFPLGNLK